MTTKVHSSMRQTYLTLTDAIEDESLRDGDVIQVAERIAGNAGGADWDVVLAATVTPNTFNIVQATGVPTLALVLKVGTFVTPQMWGAVGDGSNEIAVLQSLFFSDVRDRIVGRGRFKIESTLSIRSDTKCVGWGERELVIYTDVDRNINLVQAEKISAIAGDVTEGIWLENMELDQNRLTDFTAETIMTILLVGAIRVRLYNILITNPNTDGIYISDTYGGQGGFLNQPSDIIIEDFECTGDHHNRNGISIITGTNMRLRNHKYLNMTRADMPAAIDLEPNDDTQLIQDIIIENVTCTNCKQGIGGDFVFDNTDPTHVRDITLRNILILGTPVQEGTYSEFPSTNSTQGIAFGSVTNLTIDNCTVISCNSNSMAFGNIDGLKILSPSIEDARTHGILIRDSKKVRIDNYEIDCTNGEFNGVKTQGIYFLFQTPGVGHIGARDVKIGQGTIHLTTTSADTNAIIGGGNIKDLYVDGAHLTGNWANGIFQSDASSGTPDNWSCKYTIDRASTMTPAKFTITEGLTVNGRWEVEGHTSGLATITANTDIFVPTVFRVNASSIFSCSLTTSNAEPCSVNTATAGNIQLVFPSSTTATVYWKLERP